MLFHVNFTSMNKRIAIGWREWIALPALDLKAIKAKIDTGARTSALHAFEVQRIEKEQAPWVRFLVHPLQHNNDIVHTCESPITDERHVSDSGGHKEKRIVITTVIQLGSIRKPIEVTLTNRDTMLFRFLLGRTAMGRDFTIHPDRSYLLGHHQEPGAPHAH